MTTLSGTESRLGAASAAVPLATAKTRAPLTGSWWERLSIAAKLPVSLAVLLSVVFGGMTAAAYLQVRTSVLAVASERLDRAAQQMADLLTNSTRQRGLALQALGRRPTIDAHLQLGTDPSAALARAELERHVGNAAQTTSVELWSLDRARLLAAGGTAAEMTPAETLAIAQAATASSGAAVGPYQRGGDAISYTLATAIRREQHLLGYVVERRKLSSSAAGVALLTGLIGSGAKLLVGNEQGDIWTDLTVSVPAPPLSALTASRLQEYHRGGSSVVARALKVAETPWVVVVEFPRDPVMAPARRFLLVAVALSIFLTAGGALIGWRLSRRITVPLRLVTEAAEAIAGSRAASRLQITRADELGRLAVSFNAMADQVEQSHARLEALVEELEDRVTLRTAALEAANRELEAFSYSVSHDLRAPLRAIDGFAGILVEDHASELTPDARSCLDVITDRTRHMGQLIDDLLTFSRLGRQPVTRAPIDMSALAEGVVTEARAADPGRAVEIIVQPLAPAAGERSLIRQVFVNLIQNALKFTRTRSPARIEVSCVQHEHETVYVVRDNGIGFEMAYADKLFGVFQRLHRAEDFEGTGVGLAIVQRIIHRHGGRVWADAVVDEGATFYFTLPAGDSIT